VTELDENEEREARAAKHRVDLGLIPAGDGSRFTTNENSPYQNPRNVGVEAPSFFRDLRDARLGNQAAGERLGRNQAIRASENRAISTVAGSASSHPQIGLFRSGFPWRAPAGSPLTCSTSSRSRSVSQV
jgi:hypothetical protein